MGVKAAQKVDKNLVQKRLRLVKQIYIAYICSYLQFQIKCRSMCSGTLRMQQKILEVGCIDEELACSSICFSMVKK